VYLIIIYEGIYFKMSKNNMFDEAVKNREEEQAKITASVSAQSKEDRSMKMTLSISPQDRILVKTYAIRNNLTVSELFHQWISEYCAE